MIGPRAACRRQARHPELRRLARLPHDGRAAGCRTSPAAWRSSSPSGATTPRPATSPATTGSDQLARRSRRRRRPASTSLERLALDRRPTPPPPATAGRRCCWPATGKASFALADDYTERDLVPRVRLRPRQRRRAPRPSSASGVHRRAFERGLVLVNPTTAQRAGQLRRPLPRLRSERAGARRRWRPHTGLILLKEAVANPPVAAGAAPAAAAPASAAHARRRNAARRSAGRRRPPRSQARRQPPADVRPAKRVVVRVRCRSAKQCHRVVHVVLGRSAVVGRRKVTVRARRSARVAVSLDARGRKALAQGKQLSTLVRASG